MNSTDGLIKQNPAEGLHIAPLLSSIILRVGVVVFVGTAVLSGGAFAYKQYLAKQIAGASQELDAAQKGFEESALRQSVDRDRKLQALADLLRGHLIPSNVFTILQENTLSQIRFVIFSYTAESRRIDLTGESGSYSALAQQVRVFESLPSVERVDFGGLTLGEKGLLNFKMTLVFKPGLLQFK